MTYLSAVAWCWRNMAYDTLGGAAGLILPSTWPCAADLTLVVGLMSGVPILVEVGEKSGERG